MPTMSSALWVQAGWMSWIIVPGGLLACAYYLVVNTYRRTWRNMPTIHPPSDFYPKTHLSVLIPARDEVDSIGKCLDSLLKQDYPADQFEVLVIDDHSTDGTPELVRTFPADKVSLCALANTLPVSSTRVAYKKEALTLGVQESKGALIVCTDADCILDPQWLRLMAYAYESNGWKCITGPVVIHDAHNLLERFQRLDLSGMMLLTGAGIQAGYTYLANGAAFAFSREAFQQVGGYEGLTHLASGDDVLLMHKIKTQYPGQIGFLKTPLAVRTRAQETWSSFFSQRLRWGTKSKGYTDWKITASLALVFFYCWSLLLVFLLVPLAPHIALAALGILLSIKAASDYQMLYSATRYFGQNTLLRVFWPAQILHILYISMVGLAANLFQTYTWKKRRVH